LQKKGFVAEERDLGTQPLSVPELESLIGKRDYKEVLNPRTELFRERGMKESPPARAEALKLMSENPNLIRRPILVAGQKVLIGFDEKVWKEL
jgi:arsenate reductase (glutaredoxin)